MSSQNFKLWLINHLNKRSSYKYSLYLTLKQDNTSIHNLDSNSRAPQPLHSFGSSPNQACDRSIVLSHSSIWTIAEAEALSLVVIPWRTHTSHCSFPSRFRSDLYRKSKAEPHESLVCNLSPWIAPHPASPLCHFLPPARFPRSHLLHPMLITTAVDVMEEVEGMQTQGQ